MKTIRYTFLMLAAAMFVTACNDELNPNDINKGTPGDEVQFGAALPGGTKTIYGDETLTGFPIYWVDGDKVMVASPQCQSGRNIAEYLINVDGAGQNYAKSMTRTGEYGVQWGNTEKSDFYSVYPAGSAALKISGDDVKASLSIASAQTAKPKTNNEADLVFEPEDMSNVVMIAKETDVPTGDVVNLKYIPFSTVIEFAIPGPTSDEAGAAMEIIVQSLTLTAPKEIKIAGDFDFNLGALASTSSESGITGLSAENVSNASNSILLHILDRNNAYAKVTQNQTLKVKMCLVPQSYASLEGWTVTVSTNEGDYVKTIKSDQLSSNIEENKLKSGLVHKVTLPALNYKGEWKYTPGNWIQSLPDYKNIYLSELSLPGAWYAGSTESYQATSDIATLWNVGIRAFGVECRSYSTGSYDAPSRICVSGSGGNSGDAYSDYPSKDIKYISSIILGIVDKLKEQETNSEQQPEYAILVLSYADGGSGGHRDVDHDYFLNGIVNEITKSGVDTKYIFGYNGETLNANTLVNDALGKLIIKVNMDANTYGTRSGQYQSGWFSQSSYSYAYANDLNAMISYNPFLSQMRGADYTRPYYSNLSWMRWGDVTNPYRSYDLVSNLQGASGNADKFVWVFSSANRTQNDDGSLSYPTYTQRQTALKAMMDYSKQIYDASTHNVWFYFNCGGTLVTTNRWGRENDPSPTDFAKTMNLWLKNTINAKTDPSPLGIVMFNQCTGANATYYGEDIIKAIIEMNSRFYLKHAGTSGGSTGGSTGGSGSETAQNDVLVTNGGDAI